MGAAKKSHKHNGNETRTNPNRERLEKVFRTIRAEVENKGKIYTKNTEVPFGGE